MFATLVALRSFSVSDSPCGRRKDEKRVGIVQQLIEGAVRCVLFEVRYFVFQNDGICVSGPQA